MKSSYFVILALLSLCSYVKGSAIYNTESWIPIKDIKQQDSVRIILMIETLCNKNLIFGPLAFSRLKSYPPVSDSWKSDDTHIFIGISHYRDRRCPLTLKNIFGKAKNPNRIFVGKIIQ